MPLCDIGTLAHTTQEHIDTGDTLAQRRRDTVEVDAGTNERGDIGTLAREQEATRTHWRRGLPGFILVPILGPNLDLFLKRGLSPCIGN